jgi:hypothetical protein
MGHSQLHARAATLLEALVERHGLVEWRVRLADGGESIAISYPVFTGDLTPGQSVWLNTTAEEMGLGTGGVHFVMSSCGANTGLAGDEIGAVARREAGHLMKLRYTPLQHAVLAVEEEASPHHAAVAAMRELGGLPVVVAELHSAAMAAAVAARACGAQRIVYVMTDGAALPLALSRLVARLRADGVLNGTVTAGQAFGGDLEATTLASALIAAKVVLAADIIVVSQGPGNAGTGTPLGFSGLAQAEQLNTVVALAGRPVGVVRVSFADARPRHHGLSEHTATVLGRMTLARVSVALPELAPEHTAALLAQIEATGLIARHDVRRVPADDLLAALRPYREMLTTMGRIVDKDPEFFLAACAAARLALEPEAGVRLDVSIPAPASTFTRDFERPNTETPDDDP